MATPSLPSETLDPNAPWAVDLGGIHVVFGEGSLAELGRAAAELGLRRPLLVTDPGIERAGHVERARRSLEEAGLRVATFDGVEENPTTVHVGRGVDAARAHDADGLIGLGGGSSMDCAKAINFLFTGGGRMEDYWGADKATRPMLPSIGVPTTAGTGSEGQRFALISQAETHAKMACGDRKARFRTVLLDPELISSMPRSVAAVTGMDALSHALESFVTRRRNPISQMFAREAWRRLEGAFELFLDDPKDRRARGDMMVGAHLAGAAIEASMLGAAHSCANPLTAHYGITHGVAIGLMLPHVIRFNGDLVGELYDDLAKTAGLNGINGHSDTPTERLSRRVDSLRRAAGLPTQLRAFGIDSGNLDHWAKGALDQWTAQFNPRDLRGEDLRRLYEAAL